MSFDTQNLPVPAADGMVDGMKSNVDFKQVSNMVQLLLLLLLLSRMQGSHLRLLVLQMKRIDQVNQFVQR